MTDNHSFFMLSISYLHAKLFFMRKLSILLFATLLINTINLKAQYTTGDNVWGAGFNAAVNNTEIESGNTVSDTKGAAFGVSLLWAKAVKNNKLSGFSVSAGLSTSKFTAANDDRRANGTTTYIDYFNRWYKPVGKNFFLFANVSFGGGYISSKSKAEGSIIQEGNFYNVKAELKPGISFRTGKNILLDLMFTDLVRLAYSHEKITQTESDAKQTNNFFNLNSSLGIDYLNNISIGAKWIIPAKVKK